MRSAVSRTITKKRWASNSIADKRIVNPNYGKTSRDGKGRKIQGDILASTKKRTASTSTSSCLPAYRRYEVHTATAAHFRCRSHITITHPPLEQQEIQHCNPTGSLLLSTVALFAHIPVGFIGLFHNRDKDEISVPGCPAAQPTVQSSTRGANPGRPRHQRMITSSSVRS